MDKFGITGKITSFCYVFPVFISAIFSPVTGYVCDYTGNFRSMWTISSIFIIIPFSFYISGLSFGSDILNAVTPVFFVGLFYGVANIIR